VFEDPSFWATFGYSLTLAGATIVFGVLLVVPTAYWVRLKLPQARPVIEFITLLPLVIPAIVIVFGYIRLYNTSSAAAADRIGLWHRYPADDGLCHAGPALHVPRRRYRPAHHRRGHPDRGGAVAGRGLVHHPGADHPAERAGGGAVGGLPDLAIVIGEFTMAALLNRPAFGPYMQLLGANRAYEPPALAVIAFAITWGCMGLIQLVTRFSKHERAKA
jgi:putative spermidine/putrescine transport system permease protein